MNITKLFLLSTFAFISIMANANININLSIKGENFNVNKSFILGEPQSANSYINYNFQDLKNNQYGFNLKYKKLPGNRSYPSNLDITVRRGAEKIGYLFFAINSLSFLKKIGSFGMILNIDDELVNINLKTKTITTGSIDFNSLDNERFFQDTLLPKKNFQMIRPVILPETQSGMREKEFSLDHYPYSVEYKMIDQGKGIVLFQHNFFKISATQKNLIMQVYFQANSLGELREVMYAGKAFNFKDGPAKLVFYPALGQLD